MAIVNVGALIPTTHSTPQATAPSTPKIISQRLSSGKFFLYAKYTLATHNLPFHSTNHYFLTSRFSWPFMLIALFFGVISFFTGMLAMCTRIGSYLSALMAWLALVFQIITTCLIT
jgi:hypothetical protein